jgi:HEXXH motif-containing protein
MSASVLSLTAAQLTALVTGGAPGEVEVLRNGRLHRQVLLVNRVLTAATARCTPDEAARLRGYLDLLGELHRADPAAMGEVLLHPQFGAWAMHCLRHLRDGGSLDDRFRADLGYLPALLAVAALRAGRPVTLGVPLRAGRVFLPTLGEADLGATDAGAGEAELCVRDGVLTARHGDQTVTVPGEPHADAPGWRGIRVLSCGGALPISVALDDLDPFRDPGGLAGADVIEPADLPRWQETFEAAWALLTRDHTDHARAIRVALRSLVPVRGGPRGMSASATTASAFGAVALSPPASPAAFAATLVHEMQHNRLNAILDLVELHDGTRLPRYYAPWRDDPRPLGALLHGVYAHLGVTGFWRIHRTVATGPESVLAHVEFARWREQTWVAAQQLTSADELTAAGRRFVSAIVEVLGAWRTEPIPAEASALADELAADHKANWRMRNLEPDDDAVAQLAKDWCARSAAPTVSAAPVAQRAAGRRLPDTGSRLNLLYLSLRSPDQFRRLCADPTALADACPGATTADLAFVRGEHADAADGYRAQVAATPERPEAWTGLALALRRAGATGVGDSLAAHPELVSAAYRRIVAESGTRPPVEQLVAWLAPALG